MYSATRTPVIPYALRPTLKKRWNPNRPEDYDKGIHTFVDPWLSLCLRCPLPDCILPEGGACGYRAESRRAEYAACPIMAAQGRGWTPAVAAERGRELGLLEVGE